MPADLAQAAAAATTALAAAEQALATANTALQAAEQEVITARTEVRAAESGRNAKVAAAQAAYQAHQDATPDDPLYTSVNGMLVPMTEQEIADEMARRAEAQEQQQQQALHYLVPKLVIVDRLIAAGKITAAMEALAVAAVTKMRWDAATQIYADDQAARSFFTAIGADPAVILAPV